MAGAGTAHEVLTIGAKIELARCRVDAVGLGRRKAFHQSRVDDLPAGEPFDAATLIGMLHHLPS